MQAYTERYSIATRKNPAVSENPIALNDLVLPSADRPALVLASLLHRDLLQRLLSLIDRCEDVTARHVLVTLCRDLSAYSTASFSSLVDGPKWQIVERLAMQTGKPASAQEVASQSVIALLLLSAAPERDPDTVLEGKATLSLNLRMVDVGASGGLISIPKGDSFRISAQGGYSILTVGKKIVARCRAPRNGPRSPIVLHKPETGVRFEMPAAWAGRKLLTSRYCRQVFAQCDGLLSAVWPAVAADVRFYCRYLTPLRLHSDKVWRNSSQSDLGFHIISTLSARSIPESCEALIHECMHLKLGMLERLAGPLVKGSCGAIYSHPWRPDMRPLRGVFLAAHAFSQVLVLYRKLKEEMNVPVDRYVDIDGLRTNVLSSVHTLKSSKDLTPLGFSVCEILDSSCAER